jgi:hypothetical protein
LFSKKNHAKQLILITQSIFKLNDSQRKTLRGYIITYIRVEDVSQRLAHKAEVGEVVLLALDLLILLWVGGGVTGEVEVAEGSTRSEHDLLKLLLLLVSIVVLLLLVALIVGVIPVIIVVVVLVGGVEFLPLGAVGDEMGGVAALEAAPRWSHPLLAELMQGSQLSHQ